MVSQWVAGSACIYTYFRIYTIIYLLCTEEANNRRRWVRGVVEEERKD